MDILIGFAAAAMKAAVSAATGNGIIQAIANHGIQTGADKCSQYLREAQKQLSEILTDKSLGKWNIPQDQTAYIREELKELFDTISGQDNLLKDCQYDAESLTNVLYKRYKEQKKDAIAYGAQIRKILSVMAEKSISLEKERAGFMPDILINIQKGQDDQTQLIRELFSIVNESTKTTLEDKRNAMPSERKKRLPDRTEEYQNKWNENMFLNDFDEDDEDAGTNILLRDLYQTPYYRLNGQEKDLSNLENRLYKHTAGQDTKNRMLLILGQPGMGKSTLITWFINQLYEKDDPNEKEILVYRFTDIQINWNFNPEENIDSVILEHLNMTKHDLSGKILILDGFDEVSVGSCRRDILNHLYRTWACDTRIKNFSLLITCRENYFEDLSQLLFPYITLQPWNEDLIHDFCRNYETLAKSRIADEAITKMQNMKEVFGIPILLYMTLALEIAVKDESSMVEVYDQIFSLEAGGLYDRCLKRSILRSWDDVHRIAEIKRQIHQFSREISMWMFENNPEQASIPQKEYEKIQSKIFQEGELSIKDQGKDVFIGNYFKLVRCYEGADTEELTFVHRSIYEYFVAETICSEIKQTVTELTVESQEQLAGILGYRLKSGRIDYTIGQYLKAKVSLLTAAFSTEKKKCLYVWLEGTVGKMLDAGMLYYTRQNIKEYRNVLEKEIICFLNLLDILRLFLDFSEREYILQDVHQRQLLLYIRYATSFITIEKAYHNINLSKVDLSKADLRGTIMRGAYLSKANLSGAILSNIDLSMPDLTDAEFELCITKLDYSKFYNTTNLAGADLRGADLKGANLRTVNLTGTIWKAEDVNKYIDIIRQSNFEMIFIFSEKTGKMRMITHRDFPSIPFNTSFF